MIEIISAILILVPVCGCYFLGNKLSGSYDDTVTDKILHSFLGLFVFGVVFILLLLLYAAFLNLSLFLHQIL